MTATGHGVTTRHPSRMRLALGPVIAGARRVVRQHPVRVAAAVVVVWGGGVAGGVVALSSESVVQPAAACPATGGFYAVPDNPAHPPAGDSGASSWGWMGRHRRVKVGDRMRLNGRLWQVTGIVTMPGVEPVGRQFSIASIAVGDTFTATTPQIMCGRLIFRAVS